MVKSWKTEYRNFYISFFQLFFPSLLNYISICPEVLPLLTSSFGYCSHLIVLLLNGSQSSVTITNDIMHLIDCSFVLGIIDTIYCIFVRVWNYVVSFKICNSISFTFFFSSYWIVIWFSCFCRLWVNMQFMFIPILLLLLEKKHLL